MEGAIVIALCLLMLFNGGALGIYCYNMAAERREAQAERKAIAEKLDKLAAPEKTEEEGKDPEKLFREGFENIMNFQIGGGAHGDE